MNKFYKVTEFHKNIYRITSNEGSNMDLLVGTRKALLIDTGYGLENLRETVESITNLPIVIVNTHGHLDHVDGNFQFADCEIYMNERDFPVYEKYYTKEERKKVVEMAKHTCKGWGSNEYYNILPESFDELTYMNCERPKAKNISEGTIIDLGGIKLTVYEVPGHTWGSIALFNESTGDLYIGDAANSHLLLSIDGANIETYQKTLLKLKEIQFMRFLQGHGLAPVPKDELDAYIDCAFHLEEEHYDILSSPFDPTRIERMYVRNGYQLNEMDRPGFASLIMPV